MNKEHEEPHITVTGRHVDVTSAINEFVNTKLHSLHTDFFRIVEAKVILDVQAHHRQICEIVLFCGGHTTIRAASESADLYTSIDETISKISRRMRKHKTRIMKRQRPHHQDSIRKLDQKVFSDEVFERDVEADFGLDEPEPLLIHRESYNVRTLYKEEAIMDLELSEKPFILYKNARRSVYQIVYKRPDGDYSIIELGAHLE